MSAIAHAVAWVALLLAVGGIVGTVRPGPIAPWLVLRVAGIAAALAVVLHAAATHDALIAVLAMTWLALGLRGAWQRRHDRPIGTERGVKRDGGTRRPRLVVVPGGRATGRNPARPHDRAGPTGSVRG